MKFKKIEIEGLFHTFHHIIEFNDSNITIVIGENGIGKTVTLNLIEAICENNIDYLFDVDFDVITFEFDNSKWVIKQKIWPERVHGEIQKTLSFENEEGHSFIVNSLEHKMDIPSFVEKVDKDMWFDRRHDDFMDSMTLRRRYRLSSNLIEVNDDNNWFFMPQMSVRIKYIKTQRLIADYARGIRQRVPEKMVVTYSNDLAEKMQRSISRASEVSANLDRTFPHRVLASMRGGQNKIVLGRDEIVNELAVLEDERKRLSLIGLFDKDDDSVVKKKDIESDSVLPVLSLYIEDSRRKLKEYDEIARKLTLFLEIINKRFKHKRIEASREDGFVFKPIRDNENEENVTPEIIPVEKLSSGEQNELVLFYQLLFLCDNNDLVLIDEPEISLHISWLQEMLGDLIEISKLNGVSMLIATHSPDFVGDNVDLIQKLQ